MPLRFDVQIAGAVDAAGRATTWRGWWPAPICTLRGTYDQPVLFGHADVERGEVTFEGRRYQVTRGTIDFTNPTRIEPFFDVEAETNVRVPGQTYRVTVQRRRHDGAAAADAQLRSAAADGRRAGAALQRRRAATRTSTRAARAAEPEPARRPTS